MNYKYIIIGYSNPDLETMTANVKVLCRRIGINFVSNYFSNSKEDLKNALTFADRNECDMYIKHLKMENCVSYGIDANKL